jgi:threonylcarbamoyladenosine tRNA methylthiotransferase MtaB
MHKRRERNEMLRILSEKKRRAFYNNYIGQTREVLFENHKDARFLTGFTDNYVKIVLEKTQDTEGLVNWVLPVSLERINDEGDMVASLSAVLV